jgi:mevalonate kinase
VDNTICTYGGLVEFRKGASPKLVEMTTKFSLILVNTKVPRNTKFLVKNVALKREKHRMIMDGILETMDEIAVKALDCMKKINRRMGDEFDVLEHYETLGELADFNHNLLRCLGVSHPRLDEACQILANKKLHGKLTGAGGGGYAICLVGPFVDKNVISKVIEELNSKGFEAVLTDLGGCGVSID